MENYSAQLQNLATKLLDCMSKALKIDIELLRGLFGNEGLQSFRMNYYPPCKQPDKVMGLTAHSDAVSLTILLQYNDVIGLQIKKDGKWVSVKPLLKAFVVNIGDILEVCNISLILNILLIYSLALLQFSRDTLISDLLDAESGYVHNMLLFHM